MSWTAIFSFIVAIASSSFVTQAVSAFLQRRKVSADTVESLSDTAMRQLHSMEVRLAASEKVQDDMRNEQRAFRRLLSEHEKWDREMIAKLNAAGVNVPTAPELWL